MALEYTQKVIDHFSSPRNVGEIENPSGKCVEGNPTCGDMVSITLKVDTDKNIISDIKFKSYGCASNIATASVVTELAKGQLVDSAKKISWKEVAENLGGLPNVKIHCSVLAVDTLKGAIKDYERKNGLLTNDPDILTKDNLRERLKSVVNPATGIDVISSNIVTKYDVHEGMITISLKICKDYDYAKNIEDEIKEHIDTLKGFKSLNIKFSCD